MRKLYLALFFSMLWTSTIFAAETINGITYNLDATARTAAVTTGTYSGAIVIPEKVTHNNREYTVTGIDASAFSGKSITSVDIPATVMSIGSNAFYQCSSLNSVTIAEGCEVINANAFYGCSALVKITIPASVKRIEKQAFADCANLADITLNEGLIYIGDLAFGALKKLVSITIPSSLTDMGEASFFNCRSLTKINWNARHCSDFTGGKAAPFSSYGKQYGYQYNCNCYTSWDYYDMGISTSNYVSEVGFGAGNNWTTSIIFGDEVEHIPAYLCYQFQGELRNLVIPDNVKTIGNYSFYNCDKLVSIKFGAGLTEIGKAAFEGAPLLKKLIIPNNVITINQNAFADCSSLNDLTLGENVVTIGTYTFRNSKIQTINSYVSNPPYIDYSVFDGINPQDIDLNVHQKDIAKYKDADVWKEMNIDLLAGEIPVYTLNVSSNNLTQGLTTLSGEYEEGTEVLIYAAAKNGYQFDHWNDGNKENPRTIKMTGNLTYTAYFVPATPKFTLAVSVSNPLEGTAVGGGGFESGAQATLAAVANAGYHFSQWNDGNTSNPRQVTVTANSSYVAQFEKDVVIQKYTLTVSSTNAAQGTAYGQGTYEAGAQIAIFAVANEGYHFTQWHDGNTDNPRMVTLTADAMYFANFAQEPVAPTLYDLNIAPENATQGRTTEGCSYEYGTQVMIYAHPSDGYQFDQWSDGNKDNPRFITITAEVNLTAKFAVKTITGVNAANSTDTQTQKIVRDGQVYILRGDKLYTMQGQEVR